MLCLTRLKTGRVTTGYRDGKEGGSIRHLTGNQKARAAATFFAVFILIFLLTAAVYSVININHDCIGENCPICHNIKALWSLLTYIAEAVFLVIFALSVHSILQYAKAHWRRLSFRLSPVRLFDRMND